MQDQERYDVAEDFLTFVAVEQLVVVAQEAYNSESQLEMCARFDSLQEHNYCEAEVLASQ